MVCGRDARLGCDGHARSRVDRNLLVFPVAGASLLLGWMQPSDSLVPCNARAAVFADRARNGLRCAR